MLRDAAVDILMNRLGLRKQTTLSDSIIGEMVFVQENTMEGNATQMWFTASTVQTLNTVADDETIALPSDFIAELEDGNLYVQNDDGSETEVIRADWDLLKSEPDLTGTGKPTFYDLVGDYFRFKLTPDAVYNIELIYHQRQTSLAGIYGDAANIENNWLKHASDWLIAETGVIIAGQYLQSEKMVGQFQGQSQLALDRLIKKNTAFAETNKTRNMDA